MSNLRRTTPRPAAPEPVIDVVSPFPDEDDVRTSPTWAERLRGVVGIGALVVVSGIVLAVLVAAALLAAAIFVATTFN